MIQDSGKVEGRRAAAAADEGAAEEGAVEAKRRAKSWRARGADTADNEAKVVRRIAGRDIVL